MTKQEIEKAIENGESVWYIFGKANKIIKVDAYRIDFLDNETVRFTYENLGEIKGYQQYLSLDGKIKYLYKTKAEAEHYLNHTNITRTETLPFLTWEEFLEKKAIHFIDNKGIDFVLRITDNKIKLMVFFMVSKTWDLTEANFYKAYDECVRLFRDGE